MTATIIPVTSEAQWLAERAKDVTSTEVAALYGLSPYVTEFELWHRKRDGVTEAPQDNDRMRWGQRLESAIANGVAEDHGWSVKKRAVYVRLDEFRLGASFDFEIEADLLNPLRLGVSRGPGLLEVKNVDGLIFRDQWLVVNDAREAPEHIELQLQTQLEVSGFEWGCIVALVGGNQAHTLIRQRDPQIGADIRRRVRAFWKSIDENKPPKPDFRADADFIIKQLRRNANAGEQITADAELENLLSVYRVQAAKQKEAEEARDAVKAEILMRVGTAAKVVSRLGTVSCGETKDSKGTLVTPDMVGTYVGARSGFRQFHFYPAKDSQ